MTDPEWKADLRRQLETVGEAQVRAELIAGWLDEKEKARKRREDLFYWGSLVIGVLALAAIATGVIETLGSRN